MSSLTVRWHRSIRDLSQPQWNDLVGDEAIPFYCWTWLEALESSGSTVPEPECGFERMGAVAIVWSAADTVSGEKPCVCGGIAALLV